MIHQGGNVSLCYANEIDLKCKIMVKHCECNATVEYGDAHRHFPYLLDGKKKIGATNEKRGQFILFYFFFKFIDRMKTTATAALTNTCCKINISNALAQQVFSLPKNSFAHLLHTRSYDICFIFMLNSTFVAVAFHTFFFPPLSPSHHCYLC